MQHVCSKLSTYLRSRLAVDVKELLQDFRSQLHTPYSGRYLRSGSQNGNFSSYLAIFQPAEAAS